MLFFNKLRFLFIFNRNSLFPKKKKKLKILVLKHLKDTNFLTFIQTQEHVYCVLTLTF